MLYCTIEIAISILEAISTGNMISDNTDDKFVAVTRVDELKDKTILPVSLMGTDIILVRVGGNYYAAENHCPHSGRDISLGKLDGTILTCPFHGSKFDLIDGRVIRWTDWTGVKASSTRLFHPIRSLTMYPVKIQGNSILVKI